MPGKAVERPAGLKPSALLLAIALATVSPGVALGAVTGEAASKQISERFDVEVLKVAPGQLDGHKVWLVTVMVPAGNGNASFQVHVLAVDQETGELVPSFRHYADGTVLPPAAPGGSRP